MTICNQLYEEEWTDEKELLEVEEHPQTTNRAHDVSIKDTGGLELENKPEDFRH